MWPWANSPPPPITHPKPLERKGGAGPSLPGPQLCPICMPSLEFGSVTLCRAGFGELWNNYNSMGFCQSPEMEKRKQMLPGADFASVLKGRVRHKGRFLAGCLGGPWGAGLPWSTQVIPVSSSSTVVQSNPCSSLEWHFSKGCGCCASWTALLVTYSLLQYLQSKAI